MCDVLIWPPLFGSQSRFESCTWMTVVPHIQTTRVTPLPGPWLKSRGLRTDELPAPESWRGMPRLHRLHSSYLSPTHNRILYNQDESHDGEDDGTTAFTRHTYHRHITWSYITRTRVMTGKSTAPPPHSSYQSPTHNSILYNKDESHDGEDDGTTALLAIPITDT